MSWRPQWLYITRTAHLDMNYEDRIVCFIDILGLASQVRRTVTTGQTDIKETEAMQKPSCAFAICWISTPLSQIADAW